MPVAPPAKFRRRRETRLAALASAPNANALKLFHFDLGDLQEAVAVCAFRATRGQRIARCRAAAAARDWRALPNNKQTRRYA